MRSTVEETQRSVGEQVRRLRIDAALTQDEVADRASVSTKTVAALEAGGNTTLPTLIRVLRILGRDAWFDELNPDAGPSPLDLLRESRSERTRQRVRRARG
jgi:transcriptional regulator with XRE-family HTH domain